MKLDFNQYLITSDLSVKETLKKLEECHSKILFLVDKDRKLIGSLSDGDIRRWILKEADLTVPIIKICNLSPYFIESKTNKDSYVKYMIENKLSAVPQVNESMIVTNIFFWDEIFENDLEKTIKKNKIDIPVVIMAGGNGTRLAPFTTILPKPLIPIGDKSLIEVIINKFREYDVSNFYISVRHKAKIIRSYFEELAPEYDLTFVEEEIPLGTIGALSILKNAFKTPLIVTNCDIIIEADYSEILKYHEINKYDITLVASLIHYKIPYGICEIHKGGELYDLREKPEYTYLASTGMYILNSEVLQLIPENTFYHMTDLINVVRKNGGRVGVFPVSQDSWLDTGEWSEYKKTLERFKI